MRYESHHTSHRTEIADDDTWTEFNVKLQARHSDRIVQDDLRGADPNDEDTDEGNIETLNDSDDAVARTDGRILFPDDPTISDGMRATTAQTATLIQMGVQSQLLPAPGATAQLRFEVTNLRDQPTLYNFQVADEQRYLQTLQPLS